MSDSEEDEKERGGNGEEELVSKMLQVQSKRFYVDVKQNRRGRFIKIAEVGAGGRKSRVIFAMSTTTQFRDHLSEFATCYASLGPTTPDSVPGNGCLKSEVIVKDNRRYYLDLKENQRGRFLRVSMTLSQSPQRWQVAIPAQGIIELRNILTDILAEFGPADYKGQTELPESKSLHADNKMFYFDVSSNQRGMYMRVSEVRSNYRTAITIPETRWVQFRDVLNEFINSANSAKTSASVAASNGAEDNLENLD